jgi:ABC-type multidrug transport system fused ATPase/permease subunit
VWAPLLAALLLIVITWGCLRNQNEAKRKLKTAQNVMKSNITASDSPNSSKKSNSLHESMARTAPVAIAFTDVLMITNNNTRLNHISGNIRPGKFTAIMGGSGAGGNQRCFCSSYILV